MEDRFEQILSQANSLVQEADPGSKFYAAHGQPQGGSGTSAESVTQWDFIFCGVKNRTEKISFSDGSFGRVEGSSTPWFDDRIIPLPIPRGLSDAIRRLHEAGYGAPFSKVLLRWPLHPGSKASYIFLVQGKYIFVSLYDGQVTPDRLDD